MFGNLLVKLGGKMLGEPAQKEYTRNPSVIIAQGILESGWETSEL
ncbi:glucosaminidase domain-containing protein [Peribacillus psychrosaccharolyticus]|nr:glucosaminidase domain-containing protein [Peribacillus psychrosaccharolyticus]MEC2053917.1 glucosaminidase domain-containing protein [Peribacillus psychrosaccharolyticus]MED3742469.1 glucosaminidase domain-containing protein [Peribacillus psychrosaccharolyticus]